MSEVPRKPNADLRSELSETKKEVTDMETRALAAEAERDSYRTAAKETAVRAAKAEVENARLRRALEPFSIFAGSLFAFNCNRADDVVSLRGESGEIVLVAEAFFDARAALKENTDDE